MNEHISPSVHIIIVYKCTLVYITLGLMIMLSTCNKQHRLKLPVELYSFNVSNITWCQKWRGRRLTQGILSNRKIRQTHRIAAEKNMMQAVIQVAIEAAIATVMPFKEAENPVNSARSVRNVSKRWHNTKATNIQLETSKYPELWNFEKEVNNVFITKSNSTKDK